MKGTLDFIKYISESEGVEQGCDNYGDCCLKYPRGWKVNFSFES